METVNCKDCGKEEEYDMKPGYPRTYCSVCSARRKAEYAAKKAQPFVAPTAKEAIKQATGAGLSVRDNIIVAQVILKEAAECVRAFKPEPLSNEPIGEALNFWVNELTGAYKLALNNIEAL